MDLLKLAKEEGFSAVLIDPERVPIDGKFRVYCEENLCGKYNANYSCPPDCGSVEMLHQKILEQDKILILQTVHEIGSYENKPAVNQARESHNTALLRLMEKMEGLGYHGFCSGYNGCTLCDPCMREMNLPCNFPEKRISCMSAYCVDAAILAQICNFEFDWNPKRLYLFGMIAFHRNGR